MQQATLHIKRLLARTPVERDSVNFETGGKGVQDREVNAHI
jgi:hypothetical protein